jgi:hypothetical protein
MGQQKKSYAAFFAAPAVLMALSLCAGSAVAESAAVSFSHKDWDLTCDNTLTCRATGYAEYDAEDGATVLLTRQAGRGAPVTNRVMLAHFYDEPWQANPPVELIIAGHEAGALSAAEDESWQMSDAQLALFLDALKKDKPITFREQGNDYVLSGAGSSAVLLKMDDAQGRVNTASAILRKGKASEASVKSPIAAPVIVRAPVIDQRLRPMTAQEDARIRPELLRILAADSDHSCSDERLDEPWTIAQLNQHSSVVSAPCWMAAYNGGDAYFVISNDMQSTPELVSDSGNYYENGVISSGMKGRGVGDCWSFQEWVWDGNEFLESSRGDTGRCRAIRVGGAWDIPEVVSQVVKP